MPDVDAIFGEPRLARVYDAVEGDRRDLDAYRAIVAELRAEDVLDLGCGTGSLALLLADEGARVTGVDPAGASLAVARSKAGADRVRWIEGDASAAPPGPFDAALMTGDVVQAIGDAAEWAATLAAVFRVLRPGGTLVFETRVPAARAWEQWTPERTRRTVDAGAAGRVDTWNELVAVDPPRVEFLTVTVFAADGARYRSPSPSPVP